MNRPSRTDDDLDHPTWNQNPPFLAPDLTTRQDLSNIANARVQRDHCGATGSFLGLHDKYVIGPVGHFDLDKGRHARSGGSMTGCLALPFICRKTVLGGEGQARFPSQVQLQSWIWWVSSVVFVSTIINVAYNSLPVIAAGPVLRAAQAVDRVENTTRGPIVKRADACAGPGIGSDAYNVPLHVGALLIILGVSSLACCFPLLVARFPALRIPERFFFAVRHFGTGVLLATAFVHLLPTAFISLGNPCLSSFWTTDYPAMPGAIALVGIFFVSVIEMIFSPMRHLSPRRSSTQLADLGTAVVGRGRDANPTPLTTPSGHGGHLDAAGNPRRSIEVALTDNRDAPAKSHAETTEAESQGQNLTPEQLHQKSILQCMLLEVGILFHSVFIGMALSVSVGGEFVVLLIAIAFHQTFEGLALGARIASIAWPEKTLQPWLMAVAYGCTTPIGQAIGLATHSLYSPDSEFGLILVGTMNAVSSGLLVFASLVELLAEDFLSDQSWVDLRGKKRVLACGTVFFGAVCMSFVGAWA